MESHELRVRARLNHLAIVDHGNTVRVVDGRQTVSYDDASPPLPGPI